MNQHLEVKRLLLGRELPRREPLDELLDERGRELAWEGWRRQDLIRFGKYNDAWWAKPTASPATKRLFPIPTTVLAANPRLSQNPGY